MLNGALHCEQVEVARVASAVGTPFFLYSAGAIARAYGELESALAGVPNRIHYSVKANSNLSILSLLRRLGAGVDVVSGGELHRARLAGFSDLDIVFGGVGKTDAELREAVRRPLKLVNVESEGELARLSRIASAAGMTCSVALRVNPEVTVDTPHPYTRTGIRGMKFGIPYDRALDAARLAMRLPGIQLAGIDLHIGSQISVVESYRMALDRVEPMIDLLRASGSSELRYLDVGGGLAVTYEDELPLDARQFAEAIVPAARRCALELLVEPGRFLVGNAGILVASVIDRKHSGGKDFVIVDAGMNDLLRPSHYNSYHRITAVREGPLVGAVDVVGPVCESGDFLGLDRQLPDLQIGDLVATFSAGAYGFCMSSNYNSRPRAAEVLVDGGGFAEIRSREAYEDLVRNEPLQPNWTS